jgi:hypothetical protein
MAVADRLLRFNVEHPTLEFEPNYKTGRKRFINFKNEISISLLSSIPSTELEYQLRKSLYMKSFSQNAKEQHKNSSRRKSVINDSDFTTEKLVKISSLKKKDNISYNDPAFIYSQAKISALEREFRMGNFGLKVLNTRPKVLHSNNP